MNQMVNEEFLEIPWIY